VSEEIKRQIPKKIYNKLFRAFGSMGWWPGETPFEVIIGAILTQNTAWGNVEKAIKKLKAEKVLHPVALYRIKERRLATLIKASGYYNIKARRIKNFMAFLKKEYENDLKKMFREDMNVLRDKLLSIDGIGYETADSILLYAAKKPTFVVDAYTKRIFLRHGWISDQDSYHDIKNFFMKNLKQDVKIYNEYHALLVYVGKNFCKKKSECRDCPLKEFLKNDKFE
jgi:endonuclease-3 related protein